MDDGRLGLIDYGQVKQLTLQQRVALARLIVALDDGNEEEIVARYVELGNRTKFMDPWVLRKLATIGFDRDDGSIMDGMDIQNFFEALSKKDPVEQMGEDYVMASRVAILLRGVSTALEYPVSMASMWRGNAEKLLREQGELA